ncbi:hypothetical protein [Paenibacillus apis]|uniref:Knr4/Smi1-like domain-containing protein n=1 Tax=Paenibacillus apis TaxID=1792174 RepID=A0A920CLQ1_9BACL|nr:hypothetical protein [Paenibacillus apis]GIO41307.1 hypothetical protein J41TS4_10650 [Paenibacillus apis]
MKCRCEFYKPDTLIEIDEFQQISGFAIPNDLQDFFLIHKYDDVLICIHNDRQAIGKREYLYVRSIYTPSDHVGEHLQLSFEIFLDMLLVSNGELFGDWPKITSEFFTVTSKEKPNYPTKFYFRVSSHSSVFYGYRFNSIDQEVRLGQDEQ